MTQPEEQSKAIAPVDVDAELSLVNSLLQKAEKTRKPADEKAARAELVAFVNRHPENFDTNANLAHKVEKRLVEDVQGPCMGALVELDLKQKRTALGYEHASALERMLIDRLIACWLRVQQAELSKSAAESGRASLPWMLVWDKRLEIANKNLLRAIRTLALVRRKPVPRILAQVNIGSPPMP